MRRIVAIGGVVRLGGHEQMDERTHKKPREVRLPVSNWEPKTLPSLRKALIDIAVVIAIVVVIVLIANQH